MDNNIEKEKWIDEVFSSTQGMLRAQPGEGMFQKINARLNEPREVKTVPLPLKQWAAAAILLLALNVGSVIYYAGQNTKDTGSNAVAANPVATEIQSESTYNY